MTASLAQVLWHVQRWHPCGGDAPDRVLLERFVGQRDEAAFAALVARYSALVLRQCRRVLGDVHAAEDAFQAVFLILARKAGFIRQPEALPGWLHGIARRVALKARTRTTARPPSESLADDALPDLRPDPLTQLTARELLDILDEEVQRLPASQRSPVVLCCLQGLTQEEAARILGCSSGAIKGRLERGRRYLQQRLKRRGIALSAALAVAGISQAAAAPVQFQQNAVRAALGGAGGSAAALAEIVLRGMYTAKLTGVAALVMTLALAASVAVALSYRGATESVPEDKAPVASKAPEKTVPRERVDAQGDPLPRGAILRLGSVRYRAGAPINHAALSPDGKLLATASESGITLFDLTTGKPRHLRESFVAYGFGSLAFSPNGKQLINATIGGNLRFWDLTAGKQLRVVGNKSENPIRVKVVIPGIVPPVESPCFTKVWFPPRSHDVIADADGNSAVFVDPSTGMTQRHLKLAGELVAVASDGKTLAAIDVKRSEVVLYEDSGKELRRFPHKSKINPVALCQGGKRLVTVNEKAEIKIWDAATGKEQRMIAGPPAKSNARTPTVVSIAPDGDTLLVGTQGGDILRWDLGTAKEQAPLRGHKSWVTGLFFARDGQSLISVGWDNLIHRWDLTTGKPAPVGDGYTRHLRVARSPYRRIIAVAANYPSRLEFWAGTTGKRLHVDFLAVEFLSVLRFSPDGKHLALGCSDGRVRLWDMEKGRVVQELKPPPTKDSDDSGRSWFDALAWSPNGRFLATSLREDGIRLWDAVTGKDVWHQTRRLANAIAFSSDGKTLVSGGWDESLTFQDAATGAVRLTLTDKRNVIDGIAFSPNGSWLATCHHGGNIYLRDPKTGEALKTLKGHLEVAWSVSFSPDGNWLASSGDETVRIWEVATGTEVLCRNGHESRAYQAEFGPDGRTVLSSSMDLTALLWSIRPSDRQGHKRPLEALWANLAGEPAKAYRAIWELTDAPKAASDMLRRKIAPVKLHVDERRVKTLLADLDSDDFDTREAAGRALAAMGEAAEDHLRRALSDARSAEVQRRLRGLLIDLKREPTAEDFRRMRAVQVLELCGTADAVGVLRDWAGGTAGVPLTQQAKAALERLSNNRR